MAMYRADEHKKLDGRENLRHFFPGNRV